MTPELSLLGAIAWSEGTSTSPITQNDGYDIIVSGVDGPHSFSDYSDHPFADGRPSIVVRRVPLLISSASGRYQLELHWWEAYRVMLNLPDFSPASQDAVAIQQIRERGGLEMLTAGDVAKAIGACSEIWASLPGAPYGQPVKTMDEVLAKYQNLLQS